MMKGMVVDWVYYDVFGNLYVYLMIMLWFLSEDGFGVKKVVVFGLDG